MELSPKQQAAELIKGASSVLIFTHERPDGDSIGSAAALALALRGMGKQSQIVAKGAFQGNLSFLPATNDIKNDIADVRDLVISVDTSKSRVEKVLYKRDGDEKLNIFITPAKDSVFTANDIKIENGGSKWELIIVLDSDSFDRLGGLHDEYSDLFYSVPVINIDHHASNDYFGKVNLVDLTATSTSEILVSLFESLGRDQNLINEDVATCLLAGIMSDTSSFQNSNTTPKSFTVAAQLVAAGARQQEIVRNIFKTKPLSTLKLWGRVLAKLQDEPEQKFVWSAITEDDLSEIGAGAEEISGINDELLKSASNVDFVLLLSERGGTVHGSIRAVARNIDVSLMAALFGGGGHAAAAAFDLENTKLIDVQPSVIFKIKQFQTKRLQSL